MKEIKYNLAKEYSQYPGPRFESIGEDSGERFREEVLENVFANGNKIKIDASDIITPLTPSFLDEAFGVLATKYGREKFYETVELFSNNDSELKDDLDYYISRRFK